ncbi:hypothetical protein BDF20DRAFT_177630 [Mycotypha africana]|uniref:uncharacterized protein n=1 Tax=Mycotypha africana TaxID=64632 RepID=UPI0023006114|nr:uncharacterized protein BDF20DRAFT_177630 [Mycotypha africana]KAI8968373.1 hypothetical protein BDF20DRAFT_177630 [Mycotypha africana]
MTSGNQEWLPMPSGISITTHDSFTTDLLKQFDLKSAELLYSGILLSLDQYNMSADDFIGPTSEIKHAVTASGRESEGKYNNDSQMETNMASSISTCTNNPEIQGCSIITQDNALTATTPAENNMPITSPTSTLKYSRSVGNLLRKSSMFLRDKFQSRQQHFNNNDNDTNPQPLVSHLSTLKKKRKDVRSMPPTLKSITNTSQHINNNNNEEICTSSQSQHLTKPLKYSPVEPLPATDEVEQDYHTLPSILPTATSTVKQRHVRKKKLQRLSLPLLKFTQKSTNGKELISSQTTKRQEQRQQKQQEPCYADSPLRRRRSDSDLNQQQQQQPVSEERKTASSSSSVLCTLSKQWNKLLIYTTSCKKK